MGGEGRRLGRGRRGEEWRERRCREAGMRLLVQCVCLCTHGSGVVTCVT